jgi:hypothetical protein
VADYLTMMALKSQQNNLITDSIDHLIPTRIVILQYADESMMCLENNLEKAKNVKLLLYMFEKMSGLKINFDKSEVLLIGRDNELSLAYVEIFNCNIKLFRLKYLGVPISAGRLHVMD